MKKEKVFIVIVAVILGLSSCKEEGIHPGNLGIETSKIAKIKKGEPVMLKFSVVNDNIPVAWSVIPNKNVDLKPSGNSATLLFTQAGIYNVTAKSGQLQGTTSLSVQDSVYNPGTTGQSVISSLTGDNITCSVSKVDSMGISGLIITLTTEKSYKCLNNMLVIALDKTDKIVRIVLKGIYIPEDKFCTPGEQKANGAISLYPMSDGITSLEMVLDGKSYTGSISKEKSGYIISWTYTKGIVISPLTIN